MRFDGDIAKAIGAKYVRYEPDEASGSVRFVVELHDGTLRRFSVPVRTEGWAVGIDRRMAAFDAADARY